MPNDIQVNGLSEPVVVSSMRDLAGSAFAYVPRAFFDVLCREAEWHFGNLGAPFRCVPGALAPDTREPQKTTLPSPQVTVVDPSRKFFFSGDNFVEYSFKGIEFPPPPASETVMEVEGLEEEYVVTCMADMGGIAFAYVPTKVYFQLRSMLADHFARGGGRVRFVPRATKPTDATIARLKAMQERVEAMTSKFKPTPLTDDPKDEKILDEILAPKKPEPEKPEPFVPWTEEEMRTAIIDMIQVHRFNAGHQLRLAVGTGPRYRARLENDLSNWQRLLAYAKEKLR